MCTSYLLGHIIIFNTSCMFIMRVLNVLMCDACKMKKKIFPILFLLPLLPFLVTFLLRFFLLLAPSFSIFFSSFFSLPHLSVCLSHYLDKVHCYLATGLYIYWGQSRCIRALSSIIPKPIKRPNWMRGWKRTDAFYLSCKSSILCLILSLTLTDDTQCDPYSFSSWVSMMAAKMYKWVKLDFPSIY